MKNKLSHILSSMIGGNSAILRYTKENVMETKLVEITDHDLYTVSCCLEEGETLPVENQHMTLIIKNQQHYLHCKGNVCRSFLNGRLFTMELIKASLFIRKKDKETTWLQQLYKYDIATLTL